MHVTLDRNDYLNNQLLRAVRIHAEAGTRENSQQFSLTPSQAVLVWWAMDRLEHAIQDSARWASLYDDYADTLRCHADAVEWSKNFRKQLLKHAQAHKLEVSFSR